MAGNLACRDVITNGAQLLRRHGMRRKLIVAQQLITITSASVAIRCGLGEAMEIHSRWVI